MRKTYKFGSPEAMSIEPPLNPPDDEPTEGPECPKCGSNSEIVSISKGVNNGNKWYYIKFRCLNVDCQHEWDDEDYPSKEE